MSKTAFRAWVDARHELAPERLLARVDEVFATHPHWARLDWPAAFQAASEWLLGGVLGDAADRPRERALDLLAADACVTWAFEVAAAEPATLGAHAGAAMRRIAGLTA